MNVKRTAVELIVIGLVLSGWSEGKIESQHRVFTHPKENYKLYVGRGGNLRKGESLETAYPLRTMRREVVKKAQDALPKMTREEVIKIIYKNSKI